MKFIGVVPARMGSRRLAGKNRMEIEDRLPLWKIAVLQAVSAGCALTVLSTDDPHIWRAYEEDDWMNFRVKLRRRSSELALDDTPVEAVVDDIAYSGNLGILLDRSAAYVLLNPTHPLRRVADIRACMERVNGGADSCTAVYEDWHYTVEEGRTLPTLNAQERAPRLLVSGSIYAVQCDAFHDRHTLMPGRETHVVDRWTAHDIDTLEEYIQARALKDRLDIGLEGEAL